STTALAPARDIARGELVDDGTLARVASRVRRPTGRTAGAPRRSRGRGSPARGRARGGLSAVPRY
ncbi:MAG: hypothetical protein LC777_02730, partial [Actinobacteria bacterium]|nr:hypothetical protein [Actinomycetota bacterium]